MHVCMSLSYRSQVTVKDIAKCGPVLRAGVRNHNDLRKTYDKISLAACHDPNYRASREVCKDVFQVKCSLVISAILNFFVIYYS